MVKEEKVAVHKESKVSGFFGFAPKAPMLLACVLTFGIFDAATLSLLPVYGIQTGLDLTAAANALTIDPIINGNQPSMPIQPIIAGPAPKLADRILP